MKRPRKRTLLMVLLLLAYAGGGATINVAVAWGQAMRLPPPMGTECSVQLQSDNIRFFLQRRQGEVRVTARFGGALPEDMLRTVNQATFEQALPARSYFRSFKWVRDELELLMQRGRDAILVEHTHGWPLSTMTGYMTVVFPTPNSASMVSVGLVEVAPLSRDPSFRRLIPLRPLWPGFAINTIFYAAILWLLLAAPGFVRRRIRARRGQCPACAYPIGTSNVCTECGTAVRIQKS